MAEMEYYWRSPVGMFWIRPMPGNTGRYCLGNDVNGPLGAYDSPEAAADDFAGGHSGAFDWDQIAHTRTAPRELSEWRRGRPSG